MNTLLQGPIAVEHIPTTEDLADYHAWSAAIEREDRADTMEKIRRADFDNARSAACVVRGIAGSLRCQGMTGAAERLLAASEDVMALVTRYA